MVGGTTHQQQAQLAPPSSASSSTAPITTPEEDELLKRNTDCVYFLASPLTCKKGSECEYRHSDIARVNPRDCWYWLNGNCLNPKCAFRHPPLDGLLGPEVLTPMAPSVPAPHAAPPYGMPKQGVACIFFQKGFCLKGHLCPFLHGPSNPVNSKNPQSGPANPVTEPPKGANSGPEKSNQEKKPAEFQFPMGIQAPLPARNGGVVDKKVAVVRAVHVPPPVMNETRSSKPDRSVYHAYHVSENERILNGKDADEYSREPSPGFDVLVENKHGDSEYYHDKDEFGKSRGHDYDMDHEQRDYDHYHEQDGQYVWDDFNESDLRHRISKQRRGSDNSLRSVVSRENHAERVLRRDRSDQGALSSRLRGRIKIPGRSMSPPNENNSRAEREIDIGRKNQSRYSPGRPRSVNQSRLRDRISGRVSEMSDNDTKFAGPKRLSELKSGRTSEGYDEQVLRKRKYPHSDLSFEGPKPLSEILKRKRGVDKSVSSVNNTEDDNKKKAVCTNKEEHDSVLEDLEREKQTGSQKEKSGDGNSSINHGENEDALIDEDALLDEELEAYDHRDGDYDYEGEEDYNLDEGEYVDEDVGDEYGKKEDTVYE